MLYNINNRTGRKDLPNLFSHHTRGPESQPHPLAKTHDAHGCPRCETMQHLPCCSLSPTTNPKRCASKRLPTLMLTRCCALFSRFLQTFPNFASCQNYQEGCQCDGCGLAWLHNFLDALAAAFGKLTIIQNHFNYF